MDRTSRRQFLLASLASPLAAYTRGPSLPSQIVRFSDPATEFHVQRLTSPSYSSFLPAPGVNCISHRTSFILFSSDREGALAPYRMEIKNGESRQLADAPGLHPESLTLAAADKSAFYLDSAGLHSVPLGNGRDRQIYSIAEGFEAGPNLAVASDGLYFSLVEKRAGRSRLRLLHSGRDEPVTLLESNDPLSSPAFRPKRAGLLFRRAGGLWLSGFDPASARKLAIAPGPLGPALWTEEGRTVLYLLTPDDPKQLPSLREFTPDTNQDRFVSNTSRFATFNVNSDSSVFVGASLSKASPFVLLLLRSVHRELTICEHRASNPALVSPIFSPDSQRVFFQSDKEGKQAIYMMNVERLVEETGE